MAGRPILDRSRVVAALKLLLPLTALGLMSMIFLLASPVDPTRALDSAEIDVSERARDPRLSGARFAGVTDEGAAIRIEAGAARSDPGAALRLQVEGFALWLDGADGRTLQARAATGMIDRAGGRFAMRGDVEVEQGPTTRLEATAIEGLLDRTRLAMSGPVRGVLNGTAIEAGQLEVQDDPARPGSLRLVFGGGVRLIYETAE